MAFRKIVVERLSSNFREATKIVTYNLAQKPNPGHIFVRNVLCGINASDINFTNGKYMPGLQPPFDAGFEAVGRVASIGDGVTGLKIGDPVVYSAFGAFAEMKEVESRGVIPIPKVSGDALTLVVSGLTASIALEEVAQIQEGETLLVTAAAGATGSFAVQLGKLKGCHVIGTCSTDDKAAFLATLGCDRAINYRRESLFKVLKAEYPKGINAVYESVGGDMFDAAVNNLAVKGRLVVIGFISGYQDGSGWTGPAEAAAGGGGGGPGKTPLAAKLLGKSASVRGFFLNNFAKQWRPHMERLHALVGSGQVRCVSDPTAFAGLESVADAVEYMYKGGNTGKVIVALPE
mmetsp:Transcript_59455/g.124243  ORF Transcript_59455/g.124243 Transcript_59455/m.124243 type:complete len:347 (-) Transcript_59455:105-1145(-)